MGFCKKSRITAVVMLVCMAVLFFAMTAYAKETQRQAEYKTFADLGGKTVGMITGAPFEDLVREKVPDVGSIEYYNSMPDMLIALRSGKIDAYFMNNAVGALAVNMNQDIAMFPENLGETTYGVAFKKGDAARQQWQEAFDRITEEEKKALWEKWTGSDESVKDAIPQDWAGSNGTVEAAVCDTLQPMSYRGENGRIIGFDVDIILLMAKQLDVHVDFTGMEFSSIMPSVESGKALLGAGSIVVSDERKEVVDFIEYYPAAYVLIVRAAEGTAGGEGVFSQLSESFERTFIRENRYQLVLTGLFTTVMITVASGLAGIVLAFGLVFLRRWDRPVTNRIIEIFSSLVAGIPAVVILMVLYYIVFGRISLPAVLVAVIGFALIFGARAYGVIWNTLKSVDPGQNEVALALGFTEEKAFREIILPQASRIYVPLLKTQIVMLLKETSIAGYITVMELTRSGDLIRSRTMEAFFPLLSIAAVYYLLTRLAVKLLGIWDLYLEKQRKERRIKGVDRV